MLKLRINPIVAKDLKNPGILASTIPVIITPFSLYLHKRYFDEFFIYYIYSYQSKILVIS